MMKDLKSTVSTTSWNYETQCNPDEAAKFKGIATRLSPFKDGSHESIQSFEYDRVVFLFQLCIGFHACIFKKRVAVTVIWQTHKVSLKPIETLYRQYTYCINGPSRPQPDRNPLPHFLLLFDRRSKSLVFSRL